jgi:hypothetical protein
MPRVNRIKALAHHNHHLQMKAESRPPPEASGGMKGQQQQQNSFSVDELQPDMYAEFNSPSFDKWVLDYDAVEEVGLLSRFSILMGSALTS